VQVRFFVSPLVKHWRLRRLPISTTANGSFADPSGTTVKSRSYNSVSAMMRLIGTISTAVTADPSRGNGGSRADSLS